MAPVEGKKVIKKKSGEAFFGTKNGGIGGPKLCNSTSFNPEQVLHEGEDPLNEPLIGTNNQKLRFKFLAPFWERVKGGLYSINKIRTIPNKISEYYYNCYSFIQLRKYERLIPASALFISLNTVFYIMAVHNSAVANTSHYFGEEAGAKWSLLFSANNNGAFSDLLNTVEGDILETEIETEDLFSAKDESESNQIPYFTSFTDTTLATKTALAFLFCVVVIGAIW